MKKSPKYWDSMVGDILEEYHIVKKDRGSWLGAWWLFIQIIRSTPDLIKGEIAWRTGLYINFFKTAFRTLLKNKTYSLINVLGMGIGICAVILIMMFVDFESSYDDFHLNGENICRVNIEIYVKNQKTADVTYYTPPIGKEMKDRYPEVEEFATVSGGKERQIEVDNRGFIVNSMRYVSSGFFKLFSFKVEGGNPEGDFEKPFMVLLTRSFSKTLFGNKNPGGKLININGTGNYLVTGVIEDPPANSHLKFQMLVSFPSLVKDKNIYIHKKPSAFMGWNGGNQYVTYLLLNRGTDIESLEKKTPRMMDETIHKISKGGRIHRVRLQKLKDIHLKHSSPSIMRNIKIFSIVAFFTLLIACINFINMSTAKAEKRAREVGVRRVMGAMRNSLIKQFLMESMILSLMGFLVGFLLATILGKNFYYLLGQNIDFFSTIESFHLFYGFLLALVVGGISGIYPAFYLSSANLQSNLKGGRQRFQRFFRNGLVILQFAISIALMGSTMVVDKQVKFMKNRDLGFERENIVYLPLKSQAIGEKFPVLKSKINELPGILSASGLSEIPGSGFSSNGYLPEGLKDHMIINVVDVDEDFFSVFGIEVVKGRGFSNKVVADRYRYLINQTLAKKLNWVNPLGKKIFRNLNHQVIGVVEDFIFSKAHWKLEPLIITSNPWENRFKYLAFRTKEGIKGVELLKRVEAVWKTIDPLTPFEPKFFDDKIDGLYRSEERFRGLFTWFSAIAMGIALMGIVSLASYSVERRQKEICIRKVLGASGGSVFRLFSKEFLVLIFIGNFIAFPLVWFWGKGWLENFFYRASPGAEIFILSLLVSIVVGLSGISFQIIYGIRSNSATVLQKE